MCPQTSTPIKQLHIPSPFFRKTSVPAREASPNVRNNRNETAFQEGLGRKNVSWAQQQDWKKGRYRPHESIISTEAIELYTWTFDSTCDWKIYTAARWHNLFTYFYRTPPEDSRPEIQDLKTHLDEKFQRPKDI